jgi:maleate cis-trans isomerase
MVLGYDGERRLIDDWEKKYNVPVFTSGSSHVDALRALGVKRFVGTSYFRGDLNKAYAAGFGRLAAEMP